MLSTSFLATIKKICHKSPKDRTPEDIEALHELTKHNKVFSSLTEIYGNSFHKPCCKHLKYEFYDSLSWVFEYGSIGDKFYIILSGTVGVEIPKTSNEEEFEEVVQLADGDCFGELAFEGNELYFFYSGEIGFYKKFRTNPDKNKAYFAKKTFEINIANIGKGEIFGEEELL